MNIKTVDHCILEEVLNVWNEGFSDYFVPVNMEIDGFLNRMEKEGLDASSSFVVEEDGQLQGILLNAFDEKNGDMLAWNGGTAVHPKVRRKGVGRLLLQRAIEEYQVRGVKRASLEAIKENTGAIRLYEEFGYKIKDELITFKGHVDKQGTMDVTFIQPEELSKLSIYHDEVPWQCRIESNRSAQAAVFYDQSKNPIGYALFKPIGDEERKINIFQMEVLDSVSPDDFLGMLSCMTGGGGFNTVNTRASSRAANYIRHFKTDEVIRQVWMERNLSN